MWWSPLISRSSYVLFVAFIAGQCSAFGAEPISVSAELNQEIDCGDWGKARLLCDQILQKSYSPDAVVAKARLCSLVGNDTEALLLCNKVLSSSPRFAHALSLRGNIYCEIGKRNLGEADLRQFLSLTGSTQDLILLSRRANAFKRLKNLNAAKEEYQRVLDRSEGADSDEERFLHGVAQSELGKFKDAAETLGKIIPLSPVAPLLFSYRGYCHSELGNYALAFNEFAEAAAAEPTALSNENAWAWAFEKLKKYDDAIAHLDRALKINAHCLYALRHRGNCYFDTRDYGRAIDDYCKYLALDPNDANTLLDRAYAYSSLRFHSQAVADCKRVIALDAKRVEAWHQLSNSLAHLKDWKEALAAIGEAIKLEPKNGDLYSVRAWIESEMGERQKSLTDYDYALRLEPKDADIYYSRGLMYRDIKAYDKSIADFTKAIRIDPKQATYFCARGCSEVRAGHYKQAIDDCTESIKLNPKRSHPYESRGEAYFATGKYDLALSDFSTLIKIVPDYAEGLEDRAKVYKKLGRVQLAQADLAAAKRLKLAQIDRKH